MTKKQTRMAILAGVLLVLLLILAAYYSVYRATRHLSFNIAAETGNVVQPPQFLYSFNGNGTKRLQRPIGVLVDNGKVFVSDALTHTIYTYTEAGKLTGSFGTSETATPLYIAKNPKDGLLYVSDRRKRALLKFTTDGKYMGAFDPKLPKKQLPKFTTGGVQWAPVAITFAKDGTMYVTEILNGHRMLIFDPNGKFKRSIGTVGIVNDPAHGQYFFQFPNGVMIIGDEVYVADSNNRRVQVFDRNGNFKRMIVTQGLPRGIAALDRFPGDNGKVPGRFVEVDTLAHDATIWTSKGDKIASFGQQGVLDGQFSYPDDISRGSKNKLFITDTANGRVQVWGWPNQVTPVMAVVNPNNLWLCLLPLLLLPIILLTRKRRFVATPDFVNAIVLAEEVGILPARRRRWLAIPEHYEQLKPISVGGVDMGELFQPSEFSESDAQALGKKLEIDLTTAGTLALAQRGKVFCTESAQLRRLAKTLEIDVVNAAEFVERFASKKAKDNVPPRMSA